MNRDKLQSIKEFHKKQAEMFSHLAIDKLLSSDEFMDIQTKWQILDEYDELKELANMHFDFYLELLDVIVESY